MEKIENSDAFLQLVKEYKHRKKACATNLFMMQNEMDDLISAGKIYFDLIDDILWIFVKHEDFYLGYFYVPKGEKLKILPQDYDVVVELIGNKVRYNTQWEAELLESGCKRHNRNIEFIIKKEDCQEIVEKQILERASFVEDNGYFRRFGTKSDYDAMYHLWRSTIDKYAVHTMTEAEKDEMERNNSAYLICNDKNEICAVCCYHQINNTAVMHHIVSTYKGLGSVAAYEQVAALFQKGCDRIILWIWDHNRESLRLWKWIAAETGKFSQQFLMAKKD